MLSWLVKSLQVHRNKNTMQTDFSKLRFFEAAIIGMIFLGLAIIGSEIYLSVPQSAQESIAFALEIFDLHEPITEQAYQLQELIAVMEDVYKEFNLAFIQTVEIDELAISITDQSYEAYNFILATLDSAESDYKMIAIAAEHAGKVLGQSISIELNTEATTTNVASGYTQAFPQTFEINMDTVKTYIPLLAN